MLRHEACANELVWRWWLMALEETMSLQFFCRKTSIFFRYFLVRICCLRFDFTWVIFITFGRMLQREACANELVWRWWFKGAWRGDVGKKICRKVSNFFVIFGENLLFKIWFYVSNFHYFWAHVAARGLRQWAGVTTMVKGAWRGDVDTYFFFERFRIFSLFFWWEFVV